MLHLLFSLSFLEYNFRLSGRDDIAIIGPYGFRKDAIILSTFSFENPNANSSIRISVSATLYYPDFSQCYSGDEDFDINKSYTSHEFYLKNTSSEADYISYSYCSYDYEPVNLHVEIKGSISDRRQDWILYTSIACLGFLIICHVPILICIKKKFNLNFMNVIPTITLGVQFLLAIILNAASSKGAFVFELEYQFITLSIFYLIFISTSHYNIIKLLLPNIGTLGKLWFLVFYGIISVVIVDVCGTTNDVVLNCCIFFIGVVAVCVISSVLVAKNVDEKLRRVVNEIVSCQICPAMGLLVKVYGIIRQSISGLILVGTNYYGYVSLIVFEIFEVLFELFHYIPYCSPLFTNLNGDQGLDDSALISQNE